MELEFSAYGHEIQVEDAPSTGMPPGHSRGLVFLAGRDDPIGEVYDRGDRVDASHGSQYLGVYRTAESAVKAVVRAAEGIDAADEGRLVTHDEAAAWLDRNRPSRGLDKGRIAGYVEEMQQGPFPVEGDVDDDTTIPVRHLRAVQEPDGEDKADD